MHHTPEQIIELIKSAGIVGSGGAGFPTWFKLQTQAEIVLANGSECEPLLATDKRLMKDQTDLLIEGIQLAIKATGAKTAYIAVKGHYQELILTLKKSLPDNNSIRIHELDNYYPAGDEHLTVYDVTGRLIPEGGIPLDVGVVVNNVLTFMQIAKAIRGEVVTHRLLTVTGEVKTPITIEVPIGTPYQKLIDLAGGVTSTNVSILDGGPFMGSIISNANQGIAKTTSAIIVLPSDHFVINMKKKTPQQITKLSKSSCCQCSRCTDLCPRHLLGHDIHPHLTMRTIDYGLSDPSKHITSAFLCSQCGVCEMISCDSMLLSPKKIFAEYKKLLQRNGIKNPHRKSPIVTELFHERKIPTPSIIKKMGLSFYYANNKISHKEPQQISDVRIAIDRHIGAPATPIVAVGQKVSLGHKIAESPQDKLGTIYHASIRGIVKDITVNEISISQEGAP